ncbi:MAG: Phosphopantothenate-cysteine ligase [Pseudomonadota bacterium]
MLSLSNKRILLGITGGIAAYKACELVRLFTKAGAQVQVVMTAGACEFVTPLTLQALSGNPVHTQLLDPEAEAGMGHIELARWADVIVVAPATADFIARLNAGMGNDLLTTLCLASAAPLALAPAMNQQMWRADITQANLRNLRAVKGERLHIFGPDDGVQACGDVGPGRMLEPLVIAEQVARLFTRGVLAGVEVVITAGPTREAIDPVRYISNHSSGKMGFALAVAARDAGARVTLIAGPVNLPTPARVARVDVTSAQDMLDAALAALPECNVFIAAAAVADYRPEHCASQKIKKTDDRTHLEIKMVKNPDVLATIAHHDSRPFCVGFAAETQDVESYALSKMERKNLNMIIANDVSRTDIGFNGDDNAVSVFTKQNKQYFAVMNKQQLARELIALIAKEYHS